MTHPDPQRDPAKASSAVYMDTMLQSAIIVVLQHGKASISLIQRHLRIGYSTALGLMDAMVRDNIVGSDSLEEGYRAILLSKKEQIDLIMRIRLEQSEDPRNLLISKSLVFDALRVLWEQMPWLRLGELIAQLVKPATPCPELLKVEDRHLIEAGRDMLKSG